MSDMFHFYIACLGVVHLRDKIERVRDLNILVSLKDNKFTRADLANAQQSAHSRFVQEFDPEMKSAVRDILIRNVSYLGHMTNEEFHGQFGVPEHLKEPENTSEPEADAPSEDPTEVPDKAPTVAPYEETLPEADRGEPKQVNENDPEPVINQARAE